jgi:hypothetical protein
MGNLLVALLAAVHGGESALSKGSDVILASSEMNLVQTVNWLLDIPPSETRKSRFAMLAPA